MANYKVLAIGGSAGSLDVLLNILPNLRRNLNGLAIIIILHRKHTADNILTDLLSAKTSLPVKEVEEKDTIEPNNIYIVPADYHLLIEKNGTFSLDVSEKVNYSRPSIDVTFFSVADTFSSEAACLLLSGANADGAAGLAAIKKAGGLTIVQDPTTAEVAFMPQEAINTNMVDFILPPSSMAKFINDMNVPLY